MGAGGLLRRGDTWAGLLCLAIGLGTVFEARRYTIGSLGEMGPGFYPAVLGTLLAGIGVLIAATGGGTAHVDPLHDVPAGAEWRGRICIVAGIVLFIALAEHTGLVAATFACVFTAAMGDRGATPAGSAVLAAAITLFGAALFRGLLGINLPLWP